MNTRTGSERATPTIETEQQATCPLCGTHGDVVYENMRDRLFGVPGVWGSRECPSCEALWLDPRPTRASIGEAYRTYVTHGRAGAAATLAAAAIRRVARERAALEYGFDRPTPGLAQLCALACRFYPGMREAADRLIRHLPASALGSGARLLDVGCGAGGDLVFLNSLGWRASGVEIDPTAVRVARARGLEVIEGDVASAGLADETFDAVTSSHVLEHVHDPREFLLECRRVLKTGGVLVAVTPNTRSELRSRYGQHWVGMDAPRHLVLFDADNLARLAADVGLREVQVKRTAGTASFAYIASSLISAEGSYRWGQWPGWRRWLDAKALQARMTRDVTSGSAQGVEIVLIARK